MYVSHLINKQNLEALEAFNGLTGVQFYF